MLTTIILHLLYIGAIYAAGRWHEQRIGRRERIRSRLDFIRAENIADENMGGV